MQIGTNPDYDKAFAAALDWWREAGVDAAFLDEPRSWLPPPSDPPEQASGGEARKTAAPPPVTAAPSEPAPVVLPDDLDGFRSWWMSTPELDGGRVIGRVAPRGSAGAALMIIAQMPESGDREHLLAGPEGQLVETFLATAGLPSAKVYWATALPCHTPGVDWADRGHGLAQRALLRHVELVRPERLLVIGFNILPLLGHDPAQGPAVSSCFNHEGLTVPLLAVRRIPAMASQPRWKCVTWQAWLDWTA
jgi:DNA polymerase